MAYSTILKPSDYFNTLLYTGNKTANTTISGVGFQSDFTWIKSRTTAENHHLFDVVRGGGNRLYSNLTNEQSYVATTLTSWTSDGFVTGTDDGTNANGQNFASWNWKANGAGSSNTDGSITATVSASTASGFSLVKWTGTASAGTIGHGLGVAPKIVIVKRYSTSGGGWLMQNSNLTSASYVLKLNTTDAESNDGANFNSTAPTSSVFSVYNSNNTNASGADHIAYCFAEKKGYSKYGSYRGNGNSDGAFIYTGFSPAIIIAKKTSGGSDWIIWDNKRDGYNETLKRLYPNDPAPEENSTTQGVDFLSNGFKLRGTNSNAWNASGGAYIFMAFAESPFVANVGESIPTTAR